MSIHKYNLIFGLGQACGCSQTLRRAGLQYLSFPGDWTAPLWSDKEHPGFEHELPVRVDTLLNPPPDFFAPEDFSRQNAVSNTGRQVYVNLKTRYIFNHDFAIGGDFSAELPKVAARYRKRRDRLLGAIRASRRVLVVRMDIPGGKNPTSLDDCRLAREKLHQCFPSVAFDIVLLSYDEGIPFAERTFEEVEPGLFHLAFDFWDRAREMPFQPKLSLTAAALAEHFAVDDYRTPEERAQFAVKSAREKAAKRQIKRARLFNRLKGFWFGRVNPVADLLARRHRRTFEQIAILGSNCETAFRFFNRWGFVDSSLFAWANTGDLMTLVRTLENLDDLGTEDLDYEPDSRMWHDKSSGVYFHGKLKARADLPPPSEEELAKDRADLVARLAHLKEKFRSYLSNEKSTLLVYRLKESEASAPALADKLAALDRALAKLGARNVHLLVVTTRATLHLMPPATGRSYRAVNRFNPTTDVTSRKKGDPANWNRIWSEFAPAKILPKRHTFKFEDD